MKIRLWITLCGIIFFVLHTSAQKYSFSKAKMGSEMIITIDAKDTLHMHTDIDHAYKYADTLIQIFSDYDPASELNKINDAPPLVPINISPEMKALLSTSQQACQLSNGAFDITVGKLTKMWRQVKYTNILPHTDSIKKLKQYCGCHKYTIHQENNTIIKKNAGFSFDLGGIAKGYIAQKISDHLRSKGWYRHLVDAGGDMVAGDAPQGLCGWKIAIETPQNDHTKSKILCIKNKSIATSGATYQYVLGQNEMISHIIQPKTGKGIISANNVTVIASTGAQADWLATACSVLPWKESKKLIDRFNDSTLIVSLIKGGKAQYKIRGKVEFEVSVY